MTEQEEREELVARRADLEKEGVRLLGAGRMLDPRDCVAVRMHSRHVYQHTVRLHAFLEALDSFSERYGPLDQ